MQDVKIARHEITRQEIAGHENDGPKMTTGREMAGEKSTVSTEITLYNKLCKFNLSCCISVFQMSILYSDIQRV